MEDDLVLSGSEGEKHFLFIDPAARPRRSPSVKNTQKTIGAKVAGQVSLPVPHAFDDAFC